MDNLFSSKLVVMLLFLVLSGCTANTELVSQLRECQAELQHVTEQRDMFRESVKNADQQYQQMQRQYLDKWGELNAEIKQLQEYRRKNTQLASSYETLELQHSRYEEWVNALMDRFGPGIYVGTKYDWPMYDRRPEQPTPEGVVQELNASFKEKDLPLLILQKVEGSTVHLTVDDEYKLTGGMGSFGARMYMLSVVYSLASLEGVDCVEFDIQEGDHAGPGRYCR